VPGYKTKVVVVGAGISGLACAFWLKEFGVHSLVLEAKNHPGGAIQTVRRNGFLFEAGPQFPRFPSALWKLVTVLNLEDEFVKGDPKLKRYILHDGRLHLAPFSPAALMLTQLVGLRSKVRILTEGFSFSRAPVLEETLADFVTRKFGAETLNNLVDPFVSTIFQGDPYKMGMKSALPALVEWERNHGSLVRGAILAQRSRGKQASSDSTTRPAGRGHGLHVTKALPTLGSFQSGMASLPERLADQLSGSLKYNVTINRVAPSYNGNSPIARWQLVLSDGLQIETDHLILATPAYVSAQLLSEAIPALALNLRAIEYSPMCVVSFAYHRSSVAHALDGFGFMVPRREKLVTNCTFWNSSVLPGRAPNGKVLLTSFCSGGGDVDASWEMGDERYVRTVERENAKVLGITGGPLDQVVWKNYQALPQYSLGHASRVGAIRDALKGQRN
jgi:protoporphyrinogen/coproporphyrinogen III oxidase